MVGQSIKTRARSSKVVRAWRNEFIGAACGYILCLCVESRSNSLNTLLQEVLPDGRCYLVDGESFPLCDVLGNVEHELWEGNDIGDKERKGAE